MSSSTTTTTSSSTSTSSETAQNTNVAEPESQKRVHEVAVLTVCSNNLQQIVQKEYWVYRIVRCTDNPAQISRHPSCEWPSQTCAMPVIVLFDVFKELQYGINHVFGTNSGESAGDAAYALGSRPSHHRFANTSASFLPT